MQELSFFQSVATDMIAADRERDRMLQAMDDMWHNRWSLPPNVAGLKWIHKVVSSDPHDAVRAGTRVLMARINAASMAVRDLGYSRERALEQIGETDAKEVMRQAQQEQLDALELEIRMQQRRAEAGLPAAQDGDLPRRQGMNTALGGMPKVLADPEPQA